MTPPAARLSRYYEDKWQTFGYLTLPNGWGCYTLELPWRHNVRQVSRIPEGEYSLKFRQSPLISRITKGEYTSGWEVVKVTGRDYIMIHPGNWPSDTEGCILVGQAPIKIAGRWGVPSSRATFREFMRNAADLEGVPFIIDNRGTPKCESPT